MHLPETMIDLETLGTTSRSAIIAIGAVHFSPITGKIDTRNTFYRRIDWSSAMRGRHVAADTLIWWMRQDKAARLEVIKGGTKMKDALQELIEWFPENNRVWGNGSSFDVSMTEDCLLQYGLPIPWKFWNVRDMRTIKAMAKGLPGMSEATREGTHHNALDDAIFQAQQVCQMWRVIMKQGQPAQQSRPQARNESGDDDIFG